MIAVNPFTKLPHLYDVHMMEQYKGAPFGELSPHVFAVADASYRFVTFKCCISCAYTLCYSMFSDFLWIFVIEQ